MAALLVPALSATPAPTPAPTPAKPHHAPCSQRLAIDLALRASLETDSRMGGGGVGGAAVGSARQGRRAIVYTEEEGRDVLAGSEWSWGSPFLAISIPRPFMPQTSTSDAWNQAKEGAGTDMVVAGTQLSTTSCVMLLGGGGRGGRGGHTQLC